MILYDQYTGSILLACQVALYIVVAPIGDCIGAHSSDKASRKSWKES